MYFSKVVSSRWINEFRQLLNPCKSGQFSYEIGKQLRLMWSVVHFLKKFSGQQNYCRSPLIFKFIYISVKTLRLYNLSVVVSVVFKLLQRCGSRPVCPPLGWRGSLTVLCVEMPGPQLKLSCPFTLTCHAFMRAFRKKQEINLLKGWM